MMAPAPRLSFIVPANNAARDLRRCLESIHRSGLGADEIEVIVTVTGADDGSGRIARELGATVLEEPGLNAAAARNHGAERARSEVLAFVDADHEIGTTWSTVVLELFEEADVVGVGAPYLTPPDANWVQRAYDSFRRRTRSQQDTAWLASGNFAVRRAVFDRLGGFDASLDTCEDVDLCYRLVGTGGRLISDPRLTSIHHGDPRSLRALFFGELWRGRNNLTVSFRHPMTWRELPSVASPILLLVALLALLAGARALAMTARRRDGSHARTLLQSLVVATVYEVARAFALVGRAGHHVRRRA